MATDLPREQSASRTPEISIVVVSWNTRELLRDLLPSLLAVDRAEVIVVDNASSDGSPEAVESGFPEVRLIRSPRNLGFAGGVNLGFANSSHRLILLVNTDTGVLPGAIEALRDYAVAHPEAGVVGPLVRNKDGSLQISCWRFPSLLNLVLSATYLYKLFPRSAILNRERLAGRLDRPAPVDAVSGCFFLVRREAIERAGPFDERYFMYAEETDFCFRVWRAGLEVHYAPIAEIVHFGGASAKLAARRNFLEYRRSVIRFFVLHRGRAVAECARILLLLFLVLRLPYWSLQALGGRDRISARAQLGNYLAGAAYLLRPLSRILRPAPTRSVTT